MAKYLSAFHNFFPIVHIWFRYIFKLTELLKCVRNLSVSCRKLLIVTILKNKKYVSKYGLKMYIIEKNFPVCEIFLALTESGISS